MNLIEKRFNYAMFEIYLKAKTEAGYNANLFLRMLEDRGGISTAKYLINSTKPSDGYTELYMRKRLDLTVEALVVENKIWHPIFTQEEINKAKKRLRDYKYNPNIT